MLHGRETKEDCTRDQLTQIGDCRKKGKINQKRQTKEWKAIGRSRYKGIKATIDYYRLEI